MKIVCIAGMAPITRDSKSSNMLYRNTLGLPLKAASGDYISMDDFDGARHFGAWPLSMAAQSCFGTEQRPDDVPAPHATIEFESADVESVKAAVEEMKAKGQKFVQEARQEPWGQTVARFISPEGLLIGLSYAPWMHGS